MEMRFSSILRLKTLYGYIGETMSALKCIRKFCLLCSGSSNEVKSCTDPSCQLYPYRFGKNPARKSSRVWTDEQRQAVADRFKKPKGEKNEG